MKSHWTLGVFVTIGVLVSSVGTVVASEGIPGTSQSTWLGAGLNHTCAVSGENVFCWGDNFTGQLGTDDNISSNVPRQVVQQTGTSNPLSGVLSISAGWYHTCALMQDRSVKCWGDNYNGELGVGDGTNDPRYAPVDVTGLASVDTISLGWNFSCAVTTNGVVMCWGANGFGKLGHGEGPDSPTAVPVAGLGGAAIAVAAGQVHTCALLASGSVQCWGYNFFGQLGDESNTNSPTPVFVSGVSNAIAIAAGFHHTCAALADGSVMCWGRNEYGQLGNNSTGNTNVAVQVVDANLVPLNGITTVSAGFSHSCARGSLRGVYCWGADFHDQLGDGDGAFTRSEFAVHVSGIDRGYSDLSSGQHHSCALKNHAGIKCWGYNVNGQLGDGTNQTSDTPVKVNVRTRR